MITLGPVKDNDRVKAFFCEKNIFYNENSGCVAAANGEEFLGLCLYDLDETKMVIKYLEPLEDIALADGILRSALHVAAERSVMSAFYAETLPEDFLNKIGFVKNSDEKSLDIDKLFKSCCSCENK